MPAKITFTPVYCDSETWISSFMEISWGNLLPSYSKTSEYVYTQLWPLRKHRELQCDEKAVFESYTMQHLYELLPLLNSKLHL